MTSAEIVETVKLLARQMKAADADTLKAAAGQLMEPVAADLDESEDIDAYSLCKDLTKHMRLGASEK